jgi:putative ABC transport system permease protein
VGAEPVLGATLASDLGLAPRQAVGSTANVRGLPYTVIGVLQSQGGAGFVNPDDNLLVPLDTMAGRVTSADPNVSQIAWPPRRTPSRPLATR